ncbi:MAG TPA: hypothetical protein VG742_21325 [Dongiaceae bacterium]|nr:hypothetical protein [Dongiaceae bacterium]
MIGSVELRLGCRGLLHLARFDGQFLRFFDRSASGALRSFWLALLVLPFYLVQFWLEIDATVPNAGQYLAGRLVGYAYNWIAFPLILLFAAKLLEREAEMPGCIAIYNWLSLLWITLQAPLLLLFAINRDSSATIALSYLFLLYSVLVEGFVFVRALRIATWQAAVLVVIDVALNIYVIGPFARILGGATLP